MALFNRINCERRVKNRLRRMQLSFSFIQKTAREMILNDFYQSPAVHLRASGNNAAAFTAAVILRSTGTETMVPLFISPNLHVLYAIESVWIAAYMIGSRFMHGLGGLSI